MHVNDLPARRGALQEHGLGGHPIDGSLADLPLDLTFAGDPGEAARGAAHPAQERFLRSLLERRVRGEMVFGVGRLGSFRAPTLEHQHAIRHQCGGRCRIAGIERGVEGVNHLGGGRSLTLQRRSRHRSRFDRLVRSGVLRAKRGERDGQRSSVKQEVSHQSRLSRSGVKITQCLGRGETAGHWDGRMSGVSV